MILGASTDDRTIKIKYLNSVEDDTSLIYLGFFLIQNRIQRVNYMESLIIKIKVAMQIHSVRSLSVVCSVRKMTEPKRAQAVSASVRRV